MSDTHIIGDRKGRLQATRIQGRGWTKATRKRFLDVLATTCNVTLACRAADRQKAGAYALRRRDPAFAELWREALATGYDTLERALVEQALHGVNAIAIEPAAVDAVTGEAFAGAARADGGDFRPAELNRLQFALQLLNRYRAEAGGAGRARKAPTVGTAAETDALLRRKLDALARRIARDAAHG